LALEGHECSASHCKEKFPGPLYTGGYVALGTGLDSIEKRKISCL